MCAMTDFEEDHRSFMQMAADGRIDSEEALEWQGIKKRLDQVIKAAIQVKVAEGGA